MKLQRVIHQLEDGRMKYSTHKGKIEQWHWNEVEHMMTNREKYGDSAYTADFAHYALTVSELKERFPKAKIIRIVGFESEDHDLPLRDNVIL